MTLRGRLRLAARYIAAVLPLWPLGMLLGCCAALVGWWASGPVVAGCLLGLHLLAAWLGSRLTVSRLVSLRATELAREQPANYPTT